MTLRGTPTCLTCDLLEYYLNGFILHLFYLMIYTTNLIFEMTTRMVSWSKETGLSRRLWMRREHTGEEETTSLQLRRRAPSTQAGPHRVAGPTPRPRLSGLLSKVLATPPVAPVTRAERGVARDAEGTTEAPVAPVTRAERGVARDAKGTPSESEEKALPRVSGALGGPAA